MELLTSDGWRQMLSELIVPFALGDLSWAQLGDDVLEVGPGPGMTTDLLGSVLSRLTAVELDADLAAALEERMAGTKVEVVQADATSMPFDAGRFSGAVGFVEIDVRANAFAWACHARCPA